MANFPTHIGIGTLASGMLATLTLAADVVGPESLIAVTAAGILGSVLPDIDLKESRPSRAMFFGLATFFAFVALFWGAGRLSIVELWILAATTFVAVRYVLHSIFHRLSYHRGIIHSVLAGLFFACLTAIAYRHLLGRHEGVAWLAAGFLFIGYLVHLLLDEIYSVDVMDTRIKASFGTALKLWDGHRVNHSVGLAAATVAIFLVTPPSRPFVEGITSPALWSGLKQQFLPRDKWFGYIGNMAGDARSGAPPASSAAIAGSPDNAGAAAAGAPTVPSAASPITTGSVPPPPGRD